MKHGLEFEWYMCADADEIIRSEEFEGLKEVLRAQGSGILKVHFDFFYYGLNLQFANLWPATRFRHSSCSDRSWKKLRGGELYSKSIGWHFSYLGGREVIIEKLQAIQHHREARVRWLLKHPELIDNAIRNRIDMFDSPESGGGITELETRDHLPQYMRDHWEDFEKFWVEGEGQ